MRLLDFYGAALTASHKSRNRLNGLKSRDPKRHGHRTAKNRDFAKLVAARKAYWGHIKVHGCREAGALVLHQAADGRYTCTMRVFLKPVGSH
jgi:hypothetical protein